MRDRQKSRMSATASAGSKSPRSSGGCKQPKRASDGLSVSMASSSSSSSSAAATAALLVAQQPLARAALREVSVPDHIRFRQMALRDAAAVFHLGESLFHSDYFPQLYRTWDAFEVTEMLATSDDLCIVAEEMDPSSPAASAAAAAEEGAAPAAGKIVGFVFGSITEKRKQDHNSGMLGWVGVAPAFQRKNVGTVMVAKLLEIFLQEGIQLVLADTPMGNVPAIRFLQRMGFGMPVSHVYMSKNLAKSHHHHHHGAGAMATASVPATLPAEAKAVKIRSMTIDDLSPVFELGETIYDPTLYPNIYRLWSESEVVELFGSDSEFCQVAEYEGKVAGFVMGTTIAKRRSSWRYGYLIWLGVAPEVQRFGVGKRLFQAFKELMEEDGCRIMMIDTQESNIPARKFFERAGFGHTEAHVYFSKALGPEDTLIASEERVPGHASEEATRSSSSSALAALANVGFKVSRLFRFKRAHSLLDGGRAEGVAPAFSPVAAASVAETPRQIGTMQPLQEKRGEKRVAGTPAEDERGHEDEQKAGKDGTSKAHCKAQAITPTTASRPCRAVTDRRK